MWQLLDYNGKVRLQKLIFPDGLQYLHENHTLRTFKINPIVSAITSISMNYSNDVNQLTSDKNEKLHQLYLMFASSNFFWVNLEENWLTRHTEQVARRTGEARHTGSRK